MDFLEIRRKAKERAAREGAAGPDAAAPEDSAAPPPDPAARAAPPPSIPPAAKREGSTAPTSRRPDAPPAPAADARFTTWRPGSGERPCVPPPEASAPPLAAPALASAEPARGGAEPSWSPPAPYPPPAPAAFAPQPYPPPVVAFGPPPIARPPSAAALSPRPEEAALRGRRRGEPGPPPGERHAAQHDPLDEFFFRADEEAPTLGALPGGDAEPAEARDADADAGLEEYLTFRLGSEEYGVPIAQVHEVLKAPAITEVPRAPAGILGVVTVRGEVVAVFDPRRRLGLPGAPPGEGDGRIVIVDDGAGSCGLLVDAVASVVRLARRAIEPCPQGIGGASADCLAGIGRERGRLFTVLDLAALLRRAPAPGRRATERRAHGAA